MNQNTTGGKYFPINLQKKGMVYSGSQPHINFTPPIKSLNTNGVMSNSIKLKKDYSNNKYISDSAFPSFGTTDIRSKNEGKLNLPNPRSYIQDILRKDVSNSRNMDASYTKYVKMEKELTKEKAKNELMSSVNNIINGSHHNNNDAKFSVPKKNSHNHSSVKVVQEKSDSRPSKEQLNNSRYFYAGLNPKDTPPMIKRPSSKIIKLSNQDDKALSALKKEHSLRLDEADRIKLKQIIIQNTNMTKSNKNIKIKSDSPLISQKIEDDKSNHHGIAKNYSELEIKNQNDFKKGLSNSKGFKIKLLNL